MIEKEETFDPDYSMVTLDDMYSTVKKTVRQETTDQKSSKSAPTKIKKKRQKVAISNYVTLSFACIFVTIAITAVVTLICLAILFAEVSKLKAQSSPTQQMASGP